MIKLKDKRGLIFKNAFFAVLIVSAAVLATITWIDQWNTDYGTSITTDLDEFDSLNETSVESTRQQGNISVKSSFSKEDDFEGSTLRGVFAVINDIYRPFRVVFGEGGWVDDLTDRWGIPDYVRRMVISMMIFAITFAIIAILFRKSEGQA